jgi:hypothetical protein
MVSQVALSKKVHGVTGNGAFLLGFLPCMVKMQARFASGVWGDFQAALNFLPSAGYVGCFLVTGFFSKKGAKNGSD